ncbi:hypothetical protein GCM10010440_37660 [Kitasatospora cinereorecta]
MWRPKKPRLPGDYILLDETRDTNPVLESVVPAQRLAHPTRPGRQRLAAGSRHPARLDRPPRHRHPHQPTQTRRTPCKCSGTELRSLALVARDHLNTGRGIPHHGLFLFKTWEELCDWLYRPRRPTDRDPQPRVRLVEDLGPDTILQSSSASARNTADVTVSIAHRTKAATGPPSASSTTSPTRRGH